MRGGGASGRAEAECEEIGRQVGEEALGGACGEHEEHARPIEQGREGKGQTGKRAAGQGVAADKMHARIERVLEQLEAYFMSLGFGQTVRCTAAQHDKMIAFTSQLAHVVSSAYIKSPEADKHNGYSAGSYKDLTRVAKLNETMWSELFLCNAEPLAQEIDEIIRHLDEYRRAIRAGDRETLTALLRDGRERKEQLG